MKNTVEIMIDIETLDTKPSAVVASIGMAAFDPAADYEVLGTFHCCLDWNAQIAKGRTVSQPTLQFWFQQSPAAINSQLFNPIQHEVLWALRDVQYFVARFSDPAAGDNGPSKFWANSPSFDMVILESLARDFGTTAPWTFRQTFDLRTLELAAEEAGYDFRSVINHAPHDPVQDCLAQIERVRLAREHLSDLNG